MGKKQKYSRALLVTKTKFSREIWEKNKIIVIAGTFLKKKQGRALLVTNSRFSRDKREKNKNIVTAGTF